jgi:S1-C subfamily serine protease
MPFPFADFEVEEALRPTARKTPFDLDKALSSVVILQASIPQDAFTAQTLGIERIGNGIVIGTDGLVLTIGYLITEAEDIILTTADGRQVPAYGLGYDPVSGFGLVHALEPLGLPALPLGDSRDVGEHDSVIVAGGGGAAHALTGHILARAPFAGYWEYLLDEALYTGPGHPHWSGAALIGPSGALIGVGSLQMMQQAPGEEPSLINMCVPIELLPPILDDMARGRNSQPPRPWLGLFSQDARGKIMVMDVSAGGPADRAEVRQGDIILAVGGVSVSNLADFYTKLWALGPAGVAVPLRLKREGDVFDVQIRSVDRSLKLKKRRLN